MKFLIIFVLEFPPFTCGILLRDSNGSKHRTSLRENPQGDSTPPVCLPFSLSGEFGQTQGPHRDLKMGEQYIKRGANPIASVSVIGKTLDNARIFLTRMEEYVYPSNSISVKTLHWHQETLIWQRP